MLAARKLKQEELKNGFLLRDRAEFIFDYFPEESLQSLHVNFPDPWPKKRHHKNRLLQRHFLDAMLPLFRQNAQFFFKTDHLEYFEEVHELLQNHPHYSITRYTNDLHQSEYAENNIETEFERLFQHKGNPPIGYLTAQISKLN